MEKKTKTIFDSDLAGGKIVPTWENKVENNKGG